MPYDSEDPGLWPHLLAHIYANRSAPLWKEAENATWFSEQLTVLESSGKLPSGGPPTAPLSAPRLTGREDIPLWLIRHAYLSESYMGFMPPSIASRLGHAFDPIPPGTATTLYDQEYFHPSGRGGSRRGAGGSGDADDKGYIRRLLARLMDAVNGGHMPPPGAVEQLRQMMVPGVGGDGRIVLDAQVRSRCAGNTILMLIIAVLNAQQIENIIAQTEGPGGIPGAFPGEDQEWDDEED